jgi:hypothetical protein
MTEKVSAISSRTIKKATELTTEATAAVQAKISGLMTLATTPINSLKEKAPFLLNY